MRTLSWTLHATTDVHREAEGHHTEGRCEDGAEGGVKMPAGVLIGIICRLIWGVMPS